MLIQARVEKLIEDLHQPSGIRYVSKCFSVRCFVSLAYGKGLISAVTLFVVVPQAIGIFIRNNGYSFIGYFSRYIRSNYQALRMDYSLVCGLSYAMYLAMGGVRFLGTNLGRSYLLIESYTSYGDEAIHGYDP